MDTYKVQADSLTQVADAIRAKSGQPGDLEFPLGFAAAIAAISADTGNVKYEVGEYTPDVDTRVGVVISHGLGVVPTMALAYAKDTQALVGNSGYMVSYAAFNFSVNNECHYLVNMSNPSVGGGYTARSGFLGDTAFRLSAAPSYRLKAGVTYRWLVLALPEA